jgi:hypothetical protein
MTSTLTVLRDEVKNRMQIASSQLAPSPTNAQVEDYLRLAFQELIAVLPVVKHTTLTVSASEDVTLTHNRCHFVAINGRILFSHQWVSEGNTIQLVPHTAESGDTAAIWYTAEVAIALGSTATVDSTCIFGEDWLEEPAIQRACLAAYERMSNVSDSAAAGDYASWYRVKQDEYRGLVQQRTSIYDQWTSSMMQKLSERSMHGPQAVSFNPYGGLQNRSRRVTVWEN